MKEPPKDNSDILGDAIETLELTIRSARRCAYDFNHCASSLAIQGGDRELVKLFEARARFYVSLFQSGNSMKDYRHRLHSQIDDLESKIETLRGILAEHKIEDPTILF